MLNVFKNMFAGCFDVNEIKKLYRGLCMVHHPDKGGKTENMQDLTTAYFWALEDIANNPRSKSAFSESDKQEYKYNFNQEVEQEILNKFFKFANVDGLTVEILGFWVWVTGDTKANKEALKAEGFKFSSQKSAWFWHLGKHKSRGGAKNLDSIRENYGVAKDNREQGKTRFYPVFAK